MRSVWLNMHLGGFHWIHNDLSDANLQATHSCAVCNALRKAHHCGSTPRMSKAGSVEPEGISRD